MNGMEFLEKLEQIDPAYLAEAEQAPSKKRRFPKWGIALAACLTLLVGVGAAVAISGSGIHLRNIYNEWSEAANSPRSGYVIEVVAERFPLSSFSEEVQRRGEYKTSFTSAQEALDYIGFDALKYPDMGREEKYVWSYAAEYYPSEEVGSVSFAVVYEPDELRVFVAALILTEYMPESEDALEGGVVLSSYDYEDISYEDSLYTTAAGRQCRVIRSSVMEDGYHQLTGLLVADGISYKIVVSYLPGDADQAMELLHRWADQL